MSETTETTWEPDEINQNLRQLPAKIAYASKECIASDDIVRKRKNILAALESSIRVKMLGEKVNASDIKAISISQNASLYEELVQFETDLALSEAKVAYLRDLFDACRKAANMRIEEMRRLDGTLSNRHQ